MAYLYDIAVTGSTAGGTGLAQNMPDHQAGDLLVFFCAVDTGSIAISASSGTWTVIGTNPTSSGIITAAYRRIATTSTETLNITTADATSGIICCFREVDNTTPFDVATVYAGVGTATSTPVSSQLTTVTNNALVVSMVAVEGTNPIVLSSPGAMSAFMADSGGTSATQSAQTSVAWYIQRAFGLSPAINWTSSVSGAYVRLTFALRPAAGSRVPPYIDDVIAPAQLVHNGTYTGTLNGTSTSTNGITAAIAGKTATPATAALLTDSGLDPYSSVLTSAAAQTATTALVGPEVTITTAINTTGKLLAGAVMAGNWKQAKFGVGSVKQGGVVIRVGSGATGTTAWNAYQVSAKDAQVPPATPAVFVIEPGYTGSSYANGTTNTSAAALKFVQCLRNAPLFSSQVGLTECYVIDKQVIAGGDATFPVDLDGLVDVGKSFRLPLIQKAGASSVVCFAPVQIGGGDAVNFQVNNGVIQFPKRASAAERDLQFHASDNKVGLYLAAKSGDVCKLTNSLVTTPTPAVFEIVAAATSAATWDLSGTTFIGMTVTLRPVTAFDSLTFSGCPAISLAACTLTGSLITKVPTTSASVTTDASTSISTTTINVAQVAAGNAWWTGTNPSTTFTSCAFVGGGGHALQISAAGGSTVTMNGHTFTGFGANGTTGAALRFTATTGTITLQITNGGQTPTYTSAGATIVVSNPKTLTVTGIISGSDVVILTTGTETDLASNDGATNPVTSFAYNYNYAAGTFVDIAVYKVGYVPYIVRGYELQNASASLPVAQVVDRNYTP